MLLCPSYVAQPCDHLVVYFPCVVVQDDRGRVHYFKSDDVTLSRDVAIERAEAQLGQMLEGNHAILRGAGF